MQCLRRLVDIYTKASWKPTTYKSSLKWDFEPHFLKDGCIFTQTQDFCCFTFCLVSIPYQYPKEQFESVIESLTQSISQVIPYLYIQTGLI